MTHYRHDEIVSLLRQGLTATEIGRRLRIDRHDVARIRRTLGIPVPDKAKHPTIRAAFEAHVVAGDSGHMDWRGERQIPSGTPVLRHRERTYTAARVAYEIRTGHPPIGYVAAECGRPQCVAPDHVEDEPGRQHLREQYRYLTGRGAVPAVCRHGHDQADHGRLYPTGTPYCLACLTARRAGRQGAAT